MSLKITIGADELILSLRKNKKADGFSNQVLGKKILEIVDQLGGIKTEPDQIPSYFDDKYVKELDLPMNSTQYEIEVDKIGSLYIVLYQLYS